MFHEEDRGLDKELIITKLSKLQQYLEYLKELRKADLKNLINDFKTTVPLKDIYKSLLNA